MKKIILFILAVFISAMSFPQKLSPDEEGQLQTMEKDYASDRSRVSLQYVWLLYRLGNEQAFQKADTVLSRFISGQDHNPESPTYGHWGWRVVDGEKFVDWNSALFQSHMLFRNVWDEQVKMSPATRADFLTCCNRVVEAAKRRWDYEVFDIYRDYTAYSNVFAMYIQTITLAAERLDNPLLRKMAKGQWTRWYNHISFFGIDEFASPGYNRVIFNALADIRDFCKDERIQKEATEVMDHIVLLQSAITHPVLKIPVSGISRDYRNFVQSGDMRSEVLSGSLPDNYYPPQKVTDLNKNRRYPFEVTGKASAMPFIFKSYQLEDAGMGSMTGGACFQQQIHCIAVAGKNENERAVAFLQGSFTPVNGYTDQIKTSALCVYNRLPAYWHLTQKHGVIDMSKYKETFGDFGIGITETWKEKLNTPGHIVLEAYGYEFHIFPFALKDEKIVPLGLILKHRTTTSPVYHPRPREFDEYAFPPDPDWFGAYVVLQRQGEKAGKPEIRYSSKGGIRVFETNRGHSIRLFVGEKGDTRQLYNVDLALIPLLKIDE